MADPTPEAVEALWRVLWPLTPDSLERMLADPGPLLKGLAEAGVLDERHQIVCSCGSIRTGGWRPHDEADVHDLTRERCYVTEWKPVSGDE